MRTLLLVALLTMPAGLRAQTDSVVPLNRVRAVVGDKPIMQSQVEREYQIALGEARRTPPDSATAAQEMTEVLQMLVDSEVMVQLAGVEELTLNLDERDRRIELSMSEARARFPSENAFLEVLRAQGFASVAEYRGFNEDMFRRNQLSQMLFQKLRGGGRLSGGVVPDSQVEALLPAQRRAAGSKPATVAFKQLIVPTRPSPQARLAARAKADSLLQLLLAGAAFDSLAMAESMDTTTNKLGGDLDYVRRNRFVPEFERWVFALEPGRHSPVIETGFGFHIAKVDRKEPAQVKARHILIIPKVDSSDIARARLLADSAFTKLSNGEAFDSVLAKYNDLTVNPHATFPPMRRDSLPVEYSVAFRDKKAGDLVSPFETPDIRTGVPAFVAVLITAVTEAAEYTDEELRAGIRRQLQESAGMRQYLEKMKKQMFIRIFP